jgi:hypothetical protein
MGAQNKHGILDMVEKDEVYWFISQSSCCFQHKVLNFAILKKIMEIIHPPLFSHNKHQKIISK